MERERLPPPQLSEGLDALELAALRRIRIGCIGPGGTGKSTFARHVHDHHGVPLVSEGVREWLDANGRTGLAGLSAEEVGRLSWHVLEHRDRLTAQPPFIADRTALDSICFARALPFELEGFVERAEELAARIDVFLFFPYRSELLATDGIRQTNPVFQLAMAADLFAELRRLGLLSRVHVFRHHLSFDENLRGAIRTADAPPPAGELRLGLYDPCAGRRDAAER
jgi:hypothetical protein